MGLPYLHQALLATGHPFGLRVFLVDGDTVSETNCVRQPFARSEFGLYKAVVLINRLNLFWGVDWEAVPHQVTCGRDLGFRFSDLLCRHACGPGGHSSHRQPQVEAFQLLVRRGKYVGPRSVCARSAAAQGPKGQGRALAVCSRVVPSIVHSSADKRDRLPACSAAESLERQLPYVNSTIANHALALLARLFRYGKVGYHAAL